MMNINNKRDFMKAASKRLQPVRTAWNIVIWGHKDSADHIEDHLPFYAASTFIRFGAATLAVGTMMEQLSHGALKPLLNHMPQDERSGSILMAITVAGLLNDCAVKAFLKDWGQLFIEKPKAKISVSNTAYENDTHLPTNDGTEPFKTNPEFLKIIASKNPPDQTPDKTAHQQHLTVQ